MASTVVAFRHIIGMMPSYGPQYEDISRTGYAGHRFAYSGTRGGRATVTGLEFFDTKENAQAKIDNIAAMQGQVVFLLDTTKNQQWQVLIHAARSDGPRAVVVTITGKNYQARVEMDVTRVA